MMKRNRLIAFLLAVLMLSTALAACADKTGKNTGGEDDASTPPPETDDGYVHDNLPDGLDFNQREIKILHYSDTNFCDDPEDTTEIVNKALYARDRAVEDRLNVKITNLHMPYTWDTRDAYLNNIRASVLNDDGAYDIVSGQYATMPGLISDGIMLNLMELDYLDFDQPWYVKGLVEETTIAGKLYFISGSINLNSIKDICCLFYNRDLMETIHKTRDISDIVFNGDWIFETMDEMVLASYDDLNGSTTVDEADQFGYIAGDENQITPYTQAFNLKVTTMNEDGYPEITLNNEATYNAVITLCEFFHGNKGVWFNKGSGTIFQEGRALFTGAMFSSAKALTEEMNNEFGLAPMPKYDENQDNYYAALNEGNTLYGIVSSCKNPDEVAAVMEAFSCESYNSVEPAYYETALKVRYSKDEDTGAMFDLIRSGVLYNFGSVYGFIMNMLNIQIRFAVALNDTNWVSRVTSVEKSSAPLIDKLYEAVVALP